MKKHTLALAIGLGALAVNGLAFLFFQGRKPEIEETRKVWLFQVPGTLDPFDQFASLDFSPAHGIFGTLVIDSTPYLAERWETSPDQLRWTFHLKPELSFQNGEKITPDHWIQSWAKAAGRLSTLNSPPEELQTLLPGLRRASARENSIEIPFEKPMPNALQWLSLPIFAVRHPTESEKPIASGAYRLRKINGREIVLAARPEFSYEGQHPQIIPLIKFGSSPVKNPAFDVVPAREQERDLSTDHRRVAGQNVLLGYLACRNWAEDGPCRDETLRAKLRLRVMEALELLDREAELPMPKVEGSAKKLRYRLSNLSDPRTQQIRRAIELSAVEAGMRPDEASNVFKSRQKVDLELLWIHAPAFAEGLYPELIRLSSWYTGLGAPSEAPLKTVLWPVARILSAYWVKAGSQDSRLPPEALTSEASLRSTLLFPRFAPAVETK